VSQYALDPTTRIVVTGIGAVTPLGLTVEETWTNAVAGCSGIRSHCFEQYPQIHASVAGMVSERFSAKDVLDGVLPRKEIANYLHRTTQFSLAATLEALQQAGLLVANTGEDAKEKRLVIDAGIVDPTAIATIIGTGIGGGEAIGEVQRSLDAGKEARPKHILYTLPERVVTPVTKAFGIKGPAYTVVAACATGNIAITSGIKELLTGDADVAIVGGTEACNVPVGSSMFDCIHALDREPNPAHTPRPLDKSAGGFVMGEGAGVLVLERLDHARRRSATVLAEVLGYGNSADAFHDTEPSGEGAERAMRLAVARARTKAADGPIYINLHATATPTGDPIEMRSVASVYGERRDQVAGLSATKSATGHLLGAAGAVEAIFSIQALRTQTLPPTLHLEDPIDEARGWNCIPREAQTAEIVQAHSNAFGFGGENSTVIFGKV
jgi:3-oxoacyl-[acyl-carrier-protein] synthase II